MAGRRLSRGIHDRGAPAAEESGAGLPGQLKGFLSRLSAARDAAGAGPPEGSQKDGPGEWGRSGE